MVQPTTVDFESTMVSEARRSGYFRTMEAAKVQGVDLGLGKPNVSVTIHHPRTIARRSPER